MEWTNEHINEWIKCRDSIEYFANNYIKIVNVDRGLERITLNEFQLYILDRFKKSRFIWDTPARQSGKTTIAAIIILHRALFEENRVTMIYGYKQLLTNAVLSMVRAMYANLPEFMQIPLTTNNKTCLVFSNGCAIYSAGSSENMGRGRAVSFIYMDEAEYISNAQQIFSSIYPAMATCQNAKILAMSTSWFKETFDRLNRETTGAIDV